MKTKKASLFLILALIACQVKKDDSQFQSELQAINLKRGEIALCGTATFGDVKFGLSCEEKVRADFNLATALLHSFEYSEAEKVFAKVIDADPKCLMAYWGVAMSNFHPLWAPPTPEELQKGSKTVALARSLENNSKRESEYLEAIAVIYDGYDSLSHGARVLKFEKAAEMIYEQNPDDKEAAIFYALALRAASDPADKTFVKQKKAGEILTAMFPNEPNHPGIAHYIIHTYDYPELAELALPAARKYSVIASSSAHAQHMPSHIFTRLGLWDESIQSNTNSVEAAKCYAEKTGIKGHWDQELHGIDYLVYAYLQQGRIDEAWKQVAYVDSITEVFPNSLVDAYSFAAVPARFAVETRDWKAAASIELKPANFPWEKFQWEQSNFHFGKLLGNVHLNNLNEANKSLETLKTIHTNLSAQKRGYEANQVLIQIKASEGWIQFAQGKKKEAIASMIASADMEDATEKHPVTPGEIIPARELLGDLYMNMGDPAKALEAYQANIKRHPGRFNGIYGAALAAKKLGNAKAAAQYFQQLKDLSKPTGKERPELKEAESYLKSNS